MIRLAQPSDLNAIIAYDPVAKTESIRIKELTEAVNEQRCWVYTLTDIPIAHVVLDYHFFNQCFMQLLHTSRSHRGKGIARALVDHAYTQKPNLKFFTSTNESNLPMHDLLPKMGFIKVGQIEGLDEGDPEIFYMRPRR